MLVVQKNQEGNLEGFLASKGFSAMLVVQKMQVDFGVDYWIGLELSIDEVFRTKLEGFPDCFDLNAILVVIAGC